MLNHSKILVVDDETRLCDSLKVLLSTRNYEVETCCSGDEALAFLTRDAFDLVLLDIFMEGMDGFQVIEKLTNKKIKTPVIIMTGKTSTDTAVKTFRMGAKDYLKKPFQPDELFASVSNTLKRQEDLLNEKTHKKQAEQGREKLIRALQDALENVKTLSGLLPICAHCKKIRDDKGYWNQIEAHVQKHSYASFSHSMCPVCAEELYGNEDWFIKMKEKKQKTQGSTLVNGQV